MITVNKVTKRYADHLALDSISLEVPQQSIYGLLGPNGAGKTTLIRILNQITAPDSGEVLINGERLCPKHIATIGYLPEERGLYKKMKVGEQAVYLAQLKGLGKSEAENRLNQWFERFGITDWWNKKIEELSKGMQQKVQFVTTVIHNPKILIFDEPFSGFDPINANQLKETILELRDQGATILLSTHNMASVEELCDNITLINKGHCILAGRLNDIKRQYDTLTKEIVLRVNQPERLAALTDTYNNIEVSSHAEGNCLRVVNPSNEEIHQIIEAGDLVSFKEVLPSINDIFIQEVQSKKTEA